MRHAPKGRCAVRMGIAALMMSFISNNAAAEPWIFEGSVFFDRNASDFADEEGGRQKLQTRLGTSIVGRRPYDLGTGQKGELDFSVSYERYPSNRHADRYFIDAEIDHKIPLSAGSLRQLRISLEGTHARDDHDWVFNRTRMGTTLNWALASRNVVQTRARIGYRDQNDVYTFVGYDQSEFLLDLAHNWRSAGSVQRIHSALYYERREADRRTFSYDEVGFRLIGRHRATDRAELVGRALGFIRNYDEGGRRDRRLTGTFGIEWQATDQITLGAYVGYQRNHSTFDEKDYGGGLIGLRLGRTF